MWSRFGAFWFILDITRTFETGFFLWGDETDLCPFTLVAVSAVDGHFLSSRFHPTSTVNKSDTSVESVFFARC